nr:putative PilW family protein [uncultured bacterium]
MRTTHSSRGFTIAELLIAMVLGLFLTAVVVTTYLSSKTSFRATESVARAQENTRFAVGFLVRDIRMAGYSVCTEGVSQRNFLDTSSAAYTPSIANAVFGWEFAGTDVSDTYALDYAAIGSLNFTDAEVATARSSNAAAAADYDGALPTVLADFEPLKGSDIIAVSISAPVTFAVDTLFDRRVTTLNIIDSDGNAVASDIENGQVLKVGDCAALDIFQNEASKTSTFLSAGTGGTPAILPGNKINASFRWQKSWGSDASVYTVETRVFYVGTGANGSPSLFLFTSDCGLGTGCPGAASVELVEGVESLQILYGEDTDSDRVVNRFVSADSVADFADVTTIKLGLLMRSPNTGKETEDTDSYDLISNITINPPDNAVLRFVNNTTVKLNNRGL